MEVSLRRKCENIFEHYWDKRKDLNSYQVEVHNSHDPNDKRKIYNGNDQQDQNKEVDEAFSPAIDTNHVNYSCWVLVVPINFLCLSWRHFEQPSAFAT